MDSEILIKPLSLWPEYSMGGLLILLKLGAKMNLKMSLKTEF